MARPPSGKSPSFRVELCDFWRFVQQPTLAGRLRPRRHASGLQADWWSGVPWGRLLAWAAFLWGVNLLALGPVAVMAAGLAGAAHRLDVHNIPWLTAVLWAPLVEELLFRYGLRRPLQALWLCPALLPAVLWGPQAWTLALVALVLLAACWSLRRSAPRRGKWSTPWRRHYRQHFGLVFHLAALTFAAVHLSNFVMAGKAYWLYPLLVLPQWLTGLALGWMRVRRGIGASIALHALFNGGPVLLIWAVMRWLPEIAV